jgi:hypothetical protein
MSVMNKEDTMLTKNMGTVDRTVRVVLGLILLVVGFAALSGVLGTIVGILGGILVVTAVLGWCPLYMPFGISTKQS